jgi:hypothetical protein
LIDPVSRTLNQGHPFCTERAKTNGMTIASWSLRAL